MRGSITHVTVSHALAEVLVQHLSKSILVLASRLQAEPVTYSLFSAIFGTQAVVFAKCLAVLLQAPSALAHPLIYLCLVGWLSFVVVWLRRLNDALGKYNALTVIPLLQASYIFLAIINGGIFFSEVRQ